MAKTKKEYLAYLEQIREEKYQFYFESICERWTAIKDSVEEDFIKNKFQEMAEDPNNSDGFSFNPAQYKSNKAYINIFADDLENSGLLNGFDGDILRLKAELKSYFKDKGEFEMNDIDLSAFKIIPDKKFSF